jgi:hypothetical protein
VISNFSYNHVAHVEMAALHVLRLGVVLRVVGQVTRAHVVGARSSEQDLGKDEV